MGHAYKHDQEKFVGEDIVYTDDTDLLVCDEIEEYQQVQALGDVWSSSGSGSDDRSDMESIGSGNAVGNLHDMTEDEWNALCGTCDVADMEASVETHADIVAGDATVELHQNSHSRNVEVERCAPEAEQFYSRHPRDPTLAFGRDNYEDTGYLEPSEQTKSLVGIKHARSKSVLWPCDGMKLLEVLRGVHRSPFEIERNDTNLRREYVEEARLIHEDVFVELTKLFPCDAQLHRLLLLENVRSWPEWHQIGERVKAANDWQKHLYMMDIITKFVRKCQENCIYEEFPSDKAYRLTLDGSGFAIGHLGGQPCNSLTYSILQLLLVFKIINYPPTGSKREMWCHELCEKMETFV